MLLLKIEGLHLDVVRILDLWVNAGKRVLFSQDDIDKALAKNRNN
jgi:hypothetical protein